MRFAPAALSLVILAQAAPARPDVAHAAHASPSRRSEKGVVLARRGSETFRIRVSDPRGHISDRALKAFRSLMRQGPATYPADPRLVALVGIVSDHFDGRELEIISGYRPYSPSQYTPHSNHGFGRALDFKVDGVDSEELWAFCKTLRNAGCGYYPNSGFVHLDTRTTKAAWIDRSLPGVPPQYDSGGVLAVSRLYPGG
jgi:uncharacterized protein YcbK (DUF882 family)